MNYCTFTESAPSLLKENQYECLIVSVVKKIKGNYCVCFICLKTFQPDVSHKYI